MLNHVTFEKVEEVIALAEQARQAPADRADDPHRGGPSGDRGASRPAPPLEPQPAPDWSHAFTRYLADLPAKALAEIAGLYRFGRGEFSRPEEAVAASLRDARPHDELVADLSSRPDLPARLRAALDQHRPKPPEPR